MVDWEDRLGWAGGDGEDVVESGRRRVPARRIASSVGAGLRRRPRLTLAAGLAVALVATAAGMLASMTPVNPALAQTTDLRASLLAAARNAPGSYRPSPVSLANVRPLSQDGKPVLVYTGIENCPDCATVGWALAIALSRFGTFSGVREIRSQAVGVLHADDTWSFTHASYSSDYLSFTVAVPSQTAAAFVESSDDAAIDFANRSVWSGPLFPPNLLAGRTWSQIAALLRSPSERPVLAAADNLIAAICGLTHDQPVADCAHM
jgi:hypothetical protein